MARIKLDDRTVKAITPPASGYRLDYDIPAGPRDTGFVRGLAVRTNASGTRTFVLGYVAADGRERRLRIGDFGPHTVTTARNEARRLRTLIDAGQDPYAAQKAARAAAEAKRDREAATFGDLLSAYVDALRRRGKASAGKVESELHRTVRDAHPRLWRAPAVNIVLDDLVKITGALATAGTWRQAEKTRSYIRAAYAAATAKGNAGIADLFAPFEHLTNIARDLGTIERPAGTGPDKRALTAAELAAYWKRIRGMPGAHGAMLRFHLLTGAQRAEQLARLTQWDRDAKVITLIDSKGRRKAPRQHIVPLVPEAERALETMAGAAGPYLFTLDKGAHGAGYHTLRLHVLAVATAMVEAKETDSTFSPGELRITVETRLADAGVSKDVRAHLQSHGLGGVQAMHYDRHDYLREKRAALERLRALLEPGKVVKLPARRRA